MEYHRHNILRPDGVRYDDLANLVVGTFYTYRALENYLSPIISKSFDTNPMVTPDEIGRAVKKHAGMNQIMYTKMLESAAKFCNSNKGKRKLPLADPKSHRSVHFKAGLFETEDVPVDEWTETKVIDRQYKLNSVSRVYVDGVSDPFYVENLKPGNYKYLIVRAKLSKMCNVSNDWEALFFRDGCDYLIEHIDLDYAPKAAHLFNRQRFK